MRKALLLMAGVMVLCTVGAAQDDFSKVQIKVTKVTDGLYLLDAGESGNVAVLVGEDGVVMVDDMDAPLEAKLQAALKTISDKPVRFVINTHYHGDHTGSNASFQKQATVIAHDNVRMQLEKGGDGGNGGAMHFEHKPEAKAALPILTYDHELGLHMNGEDIRVIHYTAAHTDGDSIVYFPKANAVHLGDEFVTYGFPFIDVKSGGSIDGMIAAMEAVIAQMPANVKVIPGHGPLCTLDDVRTYVKMMRDTREVVAKARKDGKTLEQMKQAKLLDAWKKYNGYVNEDGFLETIYYSPALNGGGQVGKLN
jgi:cyclase